MMQADDAAVPAAAFAPPPHPQQHHQQQQQHHPPPPTAAPSSTTAVSQPAEPSIAMNNLPYSLYDVILDLPHPGASSSAVAGGGSGGAAPVQIFYPPPSSFNNEATGSGGGGGSGGKLVVDTLSLQELTSEFGPETTTATTTSAAAAAVPRQGAAKIARFAFPEYEDRCNATNVAQWQATKSKVGWNDSNSGNLNRHDGYLEEVYSTTMESGGNGGGGGGNAGGAGNNINNNSSTPGYNNSANGNQANMNNNTSSRQSHPLPLPSYHVFSHRLSNGAVIHGHVRRYLPYHAQANGRRDVGRRSSRALVLLTRNSGGGHRLYSGMLKSLEMLLLMCKDEDNNDDGGGNQSASQRLRWFLHSIHTEHVNLCRTVASAMMQQQANASNAAANQGRRKQDKVLAKPRILALPLVELGGGSGHGLFGSVDVIKLVVPPPFLHGSDANNNIIAGLSRNDMMPMLRSLGVPRTLRLLSALMSERRVILTCSNAAKLSAVAYGAMAMMGQGLLPPPSVFVPVLPPGLASLLQTPSAYLIGVLAGGGGGGPTTPSNFINLRSVPNIGELALFDLDNTSASEPYFHNIADPQRSIPDLTRRNVDDLDMASARAVSVADVLYQDLTEVIKSDKKLFWQGAVVQEKLGLAAAKGKKAASAAMKKGLKYFKSKKGSFNERGEGSSERSSGGGEGGEDVAEEDLDQQQQQGDGNVSLSKLVGKGNYAYEQGFTNVVAEEEARIAFASFFLSLYGDLRTYLTQQPPGTTPPVAVDKQKLMKYRASNGDIPGSGMFILIGNFLRGQQLFDSFAAARLNEVQTRQAVPEDAPLFSLVANHHRLNKIDFSMNNIRQTVRQIATDNDHPGRYLITWNRSIRNRVLELTSTQTFNGDYRKAVAEVTDNCRESSTILIDTIMVLWTRMQEGRGLQWKKALLALQIFRHLLLNGSINVVAEAIDGFASIRILKSYTEAMRAQNSKLVRDVALEVYTLLVDLPVLFARRREILNLRRLANDPNKSSPLRKETRMIRGMIGGFRNIHIALKPAGATVAPAPTPPVSDLLFQEAPSSTPAGAANRVNVIPASVPPSGNYSNDLLSLSVAEPSPSPQVGAGATNDVIGAGGQQLPPPGNYSNDLLSLGFGTSPSPAAGVATIAARGEQEKPDPFNMQAMSQAAPNAGPPPTANIPPSQPMPQQPTPQPGTATTSFGTMASNTHAPTSQPAPQTMMNGPTLTESTQLQSQPASSATPFAIANAANPQSMQNTQQPQSIMNQPPMSFQPKQPQPPPMSTHFSMASNT
ncbi:hypothetical protein ACHAXR_006917, partial [Thalassiosira sp. AJA248-18]